MTKFVFYFVQVPTILPPAQVLAVESWLVISSPSLSEAYADALAYLEHLQLWSGIEGYRWMIQDIQMTESDFIIHSCG